MNQEQQVRVWIRRILNESTLSRLNEDNGDGGDDFGGDWGGDFGGGESSGEMAQIYLDPFKDVFAAAKLTFKDLLTTAKFGWDILITIDPKKLNEMRKNYAARQKKSAEAHKALRAKLGDKFEDFELVSFMFNPAGYLAKAPFAAAWNNKDDIADFFRETGFGGPSKEEKEAGVEDPTGLIGTAFNALRKLFFMGPAERYMPDGVLLLEQEKKEKGGGKKDLQADMLAVMEDLGILEPMMKSADEMVTTLREALHELDDLFGPSYKAIGELSVSENLTEFQQALENAKKQELDLGGPGMDKLTADMENSVNEFLSNPEQKEALVRALAEEQGKKIGADEEVPEVNDQELKKKAAEKIYTNSTEEMRKTMEESLAKLQEQIAPEIEAIEEELGLTAEMKKTIGTTDLGKELLGLLNSFKEGYGLTP